MTLQERMAANAAVPNGLDIILGGALPGQDRVQQIPADRLHPKANHSFQIRQDTEYFAALRESIRANGIKMPLLVRPHPERAGDYEIIAGHTRWTAARLEGLSSLPCIVQQLSDAQADRLMAETNIQRPDWMPSERAHTFKIWLEAVRKESGITQGQRRDLTCGTEFHKLEDGSAGTCGTEFHRLEDDSVGTCGTEFHKFKSRDFAAQKWGISGKAFETYVKLNDLIPPLLNMVDSEQIPVKAGYQLAFLPEERQKRLLDILEAQRVGINEKTARELRDTEPEDWLSIIGVKEAKEPTWKFTIPRAAISSQRAKVYLKDPALQELIAQTVNRYLAAREEEEGV